jgi:nitrate reductase NapE component
MEEAAYYSTLFLNFGICCLACLQFQRLFRLQKLLKWQAFLLYSFCTLLVALVSAFGIFTWLIRVYENFGFPQAFGHNELALAAVSQFFIPIFAIPLGLAVVNWKAADF